MAVAGSVRFENAAAEAPGQPGGTDQEAQTGKHGFPGQQTRLTSEGPEQGLVQVAERE